MHACVVLTFINELTYIMLVLYVYALVIVYIWLVCMHIPHVYVFGLLVIYVYIVVILTCDGIYNIGCMYACYYVCDLLLSGCDVQTHLKHVWWLDMVCGMCEVCLCCV